MKDFIFIGHRGLGTTKKYSINNLNLEYTNYIENTIGAVTEASQNGFKAVEIDIQLTKDKIPVVHHDFCITDNENKKYYIGELTIDKFIELSKINNKNSYNRNINQIEELNTLSDIYNPCTLTHILSKFPDIKFNIEIKYPSLSEIKEHNINKINLLPVELYTKIILENLKNYNNIQFISSFSENVIKYCKINSIYNCYILCEYKHVQNYYKDPELYFNEVFRFTDVYELNGVIFNCTEVIQYKNILFKNLTSKKIYGAYNVLVDDYKKYFIEGGINFIKLFIIDDKIERLIEL